MSATSLNPSRPATRAWPRLNGSAVVMTLYILFLLLPIYWLVNMSFKTNQEITSSFTLFPQTFTLANYAVILTDPSWYMGYVNSLIYVVMNTVISLTVALPAAYAFSRYSFMGDKHLFFWLLTNRMSPPAVFALPFFQLYSSVGLFDTHIAVALERAGVQGDIGPKMNEEQDAQIWLDAPGAPVAKLENEKPQGETIDYDTLIKSWN